MYLHIRFSDGSNPYIFYGKNHNATYEELIAELQKWHENYLMYRERETEDGLFMVAIPKFDGWQDAINNAFHETLQEEFKGGVNMLELVEKLEWLESHNKNYTKEQYYKIQDCLVLAKELHILEQERLKEDLLF